MEATVLIASYGYARWLGEALDSALRQEAPPGGFEVIVVHRPSGDGSEEVLSRYVGDPRVRVLTQAGTGLAQAANQGIEASCGDVVMRLDADDRLLPGALAAGCAALRGEPWVDFVYGDYDYLIEPEGSRVRKALPPFDPAELAARGEFLSGGTCYRRSVFARVGPFDESLPTLESYEFVLRMLSEGIVGLHLERPFFEYRIHGGSMSDETGLVRATAEAIAARYGREYGSNANHPRVIPT